MSSKNKSKEKNASKNKKRPKSVTPKTQKQSDSTRIIFNKKNKTLSNKTIIFPHIKSLKDLFIPKSLKLKILYLHISKH